MKKPKKGVSTATARKAENEAVRAIELAATNIRRYQRAQRAAATQVIILSPEAVAQARATALSAELAALNIDRFLKLQKDSATRVTPVKTKKGR